MWLRSIGEWFSGDAASIAGLQEWFGYLLSADTARQKVLFLTGPRRSGKDTILGVMEELVGAANVAVTTFAALGEPFGLEPLLGRRVAVIPDARLSGRTDCAAVIERLLSISGEDAQTVNRKNRRQVTARLRVRFVIASNETHRLPDASGAIASRFYILSTPNSWLGRENQTLRSQLTAVLPGILAWAAEGWVRLRRQGGFTPNRAAEQCAEELDAMSSPVRVFIREACTVGADQTVDFPVLYQAWRSWNEDRHRECGSETMFGRDLQAACPRVVASQHRRDGTRIRVHSGIGLRERIDSGTDGGFTLSRGATHDFLTHAWGAGSEALKVCKGHVGSECVTPRDSVTLGGEGADDTEELAA
ncbi:DNA primase family protein [Gemmata sp.]|uniref:DNA primase family protein n=1 Tax=Gemmata sp. TaxID=1914242 RepID=UPI003F72AEAC